jgi:hypothetical protein
VPKSLFTQKRNRESALRDIMLRYGIEPAYCHMFSSSRKFVEVAAAMGVNAAPLADGKQLMQALKTLLTQAESQSAAKI